MDKGKVGFVHGAIHIGRYGLDPTDADPDPCAKAQKR